MLNQPCFLLNTWGEINRIGDLSKQSIVLFLVDSTTESFKELFELIHTNRRTVKNHTFSICFDLTSPLNNTVVNEVEVLLCNIVFHPSFYNEYNSPHLFYLRSDKDQAMANPFLTKISNLLRLQSFNPAQFFEIYANGNGRNKSPDQFIEIKNDEAIEHAGTYYLEQFLRNGYYSRYIYIKCLNPQLLAYAEKKLFQTEQRHAEQNKLLFEQTTKLRNAAEENRALQYKLHLCNEEVTNYKQYLDIIHVADEAGRINEFYYHEYEVLPLWYKRLGHVLKVILGKRTLSSLLGDKGKKHHGKKPAKEL